MSDRVRILLVDDSEIFTALMERAIAAVGQAELAGVARDGKQAIELASRLRPDVISMDVYMPEMDGLEAVEHIMEQTPTPIVMVTAAESDQMAQISFRAIGGGALDVLAKPDGAPAAAAIVKRLCLLAGVRVTQRPRPGSAPASVPTPAPVQIPEIEQGLWRPDALLGTADVVAIAISTGGPPLLEEILRALPSDWAAGLLIVQHLSPGFGSHLVDWLGKTAGIPVRLATSESRVERGVAFIAPADQHLSVRMGGRLSVDATGERVCGHRPSGTVLLQSVARTYGSRAAGLVLTGMGRDGADGLLSLRRAGGITAAQDPATSVVDGMPRSAREIDAAQHTVRLVDLPTFVRRLGAPSVR